MFKKPDDVSERGKTQLKKKAVAALKAEVASQLRVSEEKLAEVMGSKTTVVEQSKLMSRSILYFVDGVPYFLDEGGRNKLMPTLQFLWKFPNAVRCFLIHSQVSSFVLNGANLMLPGVATLRGLEDIEVGEVMCIRVIDNPLPFAMGRSSCSAEGIIANNRRGKAMDVLHCFGDYLSQMAGGIHNNKGPNDGFVLGKKFILPLQGFEDKDLGELLIEPESEEEEEEDQKEGEKEEEEDVGGEREISELSLNEDNGATESDAPGGKKKMKRFELKKEREASAAAGKEGDNAVSASSGRAEASDEERTRMDGALWTCLVLYLKHFLKEKSLPALMNVTWPPILRIGAFLLSKGEGAGLVLQERGSGSSSSGGGGGNVASQPEQVQAEVEIKRSHHRTVSAFFDYAARQGLLTLTEPQPGVFSIAAINRTHDAFRHVRVANVDAFKAGVTALEEPTSGDSRDKEGGGGRGPGTGGGHAGPGGAVKVIVKDYYQMPRNVRAAFPVLSSPSNDIGVSNGKDVFFTAAHIKELLASAFRESALSAGGDGASVQVPVGHAMHALALTIAKKSNVPLAMSASASSEVAYAAAAVEARDEDEDEDEDEDDAYYGEIGDDDVGGEGGRREGGQEALSGGKMVAGVWCPDQVSAFAPASSAASVPAPSGDSVWKGPTGSLGSKKAVATIKAAPSSMSSVFRARAFADHSGREGGKKEKKKKAKKGGGGDVDVGVDVPVRIRKDVFMKGLSSLLSPAHSVQPSEDAAPVYWSGRAPVVEVSVVQVMGKKKMTHIVGLEHYGVDLDDLAKRLSRKFAASSSVGPNTQQPKLMEVVVQGHLASEAVEFICHTYALPSKLLNVSLKKGVKAKKK